MILEDYFPYTEEQGHPPEQNLIHNEISGKDDDNQCEKTFPSHSDFINGMFVIGCPCLSSITYGFDLMVKPESARHFFRFLMCWRINFGELEGVIEDFACGLQPYCLDREPSELRFHSMEPTGMDSVSRKLIVLEVE